MSWKTKAVMGVREFVCGEGGGGQVWKGERKQTSSFQTPVNRVRAERKEDAQTDKKREKG